jgi:heme a synthase
MRKSAGINRNSAVSNWILIGVIMLLIQVILGGITRLTGSGLSITEWDFATGAIPPTSGKSWIEVFDKYRQTPQFHLLNAHFSLSDFKFIFFWEWFHRLWARLVAVVFLVGFIWLLANKKMKKEMVLPMLILFLLGALQGVIGWIMVASGLTGDAIYVKPTRLALHFVFAFGLISYTFWFYLQLTIPGKEITRSRKISALSIAIIVLLFFQLLFGALMAGYKAANSAPTWPDINGDWFPPALFSQQNALLHLFDNKIGVQFTHRLLAYVLLAMVCFWSFRASRHSEMTTRFQRGRWLPLLLIIVQILLGITALLVSPAIVPNHWVAFDWIALLHQLTGMLFLLTMFYMLFLVRPISRKS